MTTQTIQLRVTLPAELQSYLKVRASRFGLNMSAYIKNLIINDVKDMDYPVMKASKRTEKAYEQAVSERKKATEKAAEAAQMAQQQAELCQRKAEEVQRAREASLTPEVLARLNEAFEEHRALLRILCSYPTRSDEYNKFLAKVQTDIKETDLLREQLDHRETDEGLVVSSLNIRSAGLKNLANRPKINQEIPNFWLKISNILSEWKSIPLLVNNDEEAEMFIGEEEKKAFGFDQVMRYVKFKIKNRNTKPFGQSNRHYTGLISKNGVPKTKDV